MKFGLKMPIMGLGDVAGYLEDRIGENLRTVGHLELEGVDLLYLRDDLRESYAEEELESLYSEYGRDFLETGGELSGAVADRTGDFLGINISFEDTHVLMMPVDDQEALAVSMDSQVGSSLKGLYSDINSEWER